MILPPPTSYQKLLADFVVEHKLHNLVETGLGVSTLYLLDALDRMDAGHLTSIDPAPWFAGEIPHGSERWTWMQMRSLEALECLGKPVRPWDMFLADGSHNTFSQTLEYNFAWGMLRKGGWLVSDDFTWGGHDAWQKFLKFRRVTDVKLGSLAMVQKTEDHANPANIGTFYDACVAMAHEAEKAWLASGGENTAYFKDHD